jgi:hypothetical protein
MSVDIATLGMFRSQRCGGEYVGGAIIPPPTEDIKEEMKIIVKYRSSVEKDISPLKIILKCKTEV